MNYSMKFAVVVMNILLGISLHGHAQAQSAQVSQDVTITTQTATTDDGRKVMLKNNGTWQYAQEGSVNTKLESTLAFDTGIVFKSGDVKPVARTDFHLLNKSLAQILLDGKFADYSGIPFEKENIHHAFVSSYSSYPQRFYNALDLIKPHMVQSVNTDFSGKAVFKAIPAGKYFLMGYCNMSNIYMVWDVEINLTPGNNSLTLDQNNLAANYTKLY